MMKIRTYPTLLLALLGSMDCLTTVIGILYFGGVELNPLLSGLVKTNLPAFIFIKLATTASVCLFFVQAERILKQTPNKSTRAFSWTQKILRISPAGVIIFLVIVVSNNILILAPAL